MKFKNKKILNIFPVNEDIPERECFCSTRPCDDDFPCFDGDPGIGYCDSEFLFCCARAQPKKVL